LTTGEAFPRVLVARRVQRDGHYYAGPFLPASLGRRTMALTHRLFGIRSCNEVITGERGRPCLEYDIKRCIAPCVREICSAEEYRAAVEHTQLFLEGRNDELVATLRDRMQDASEAERFEQAAQLRDAIRTIDTVGTRQQKMASAELGDRDAFGLKVGPAGASVQVFEVRHGRVVERIELVSDERLRPERGAKSPSESEREWGPASTEGSWQASAGSREPDVLQAAVQQFYEDRVPPPEVHLPLALGESDTALLEEWLTSRAERRVRIVVPKRGEKRGLLELAARNAELAYQSRFNENTAANYDALEILRVVLALPSAPRRIECFDISTIQGSETVASMVVCEDGRMRRGEYRKFKIGARDSAFDRLRPTLSGVEGSGLGTRGSGPRPVNNDFAAMHEVVLRRYRRVLESGGPFPDLVLIDGGKGQLSAAYAALEQLGLGRLIAVGIAKKEELLFTRDREDAIALPRESPALLLIQRIRDEAHRFAVTFHRLSRAKRLLRSDLDGVAGVGPRRRKALLTAFGSVAGVRRATREELVRVVGTKTADAVLTHFARPN
jgi:excinuclease ABC subunit C